MALTRTRRVLDRLGIQPGEPGLVAYVSRVEGGEDARTVLYLDLPTYRDLGSQRQVTVTVEPGDLLNGGE